MNTIAPNGSALFRIAGKDDSDTYRAITGTISTSDTVHSYIAKVVGTDDRYCLKSRPDSIAAGATVSVDVTVNALDAQGGVLPPFVINFQLQGPPPPPNATHVVMYEGPFGVDGGYSAPADPGSGTISL